MIRVASGAKSAWMRPPRPTLPKLWIRSSNQYGLPHGVLFGGRPVAGTRKVTGSRRVAPDEEK